MASVKGADAIVKPFHPTASAPIRLSVLLTPRQAAEYLGVPETTLAQWRSQRRGPPYIKLESRLIRYRRTDLESYVGQHLIETDH